MNSKIRFLCLASSLLILLPATVFSQSSGFAFLRGLVAVAGGRTVAMAGAGTALLNDAYAVTTNPATLAKTSERSGAFEYVNNVLDIQTGFGAYLHPMETGNIVVAVFYKNYGSITRADDAGNELGSFSPTSVVLSGTYSRPWTEKIWLGITGKMIRQAIDTYSSDAYALDLGVYYDSSLLDNLKFGVALFNLGAVRSPFVTSRESLPSRVDFGVSKMLTHLPLQWSLSVQQYFDGETVLAAGGEFTISENLFLRLGYNSVGRDQQLGETTDRTAGVSLGFGLNYNRYSFDYAQTFTAAGTPARFSFALRF